MDTPKFQAQDRVRICKPSSPHDGQEAVVTWVDQYGPRLDQHEYSIQLLDGAGMAPGPTYFFHEPYLEKIGTFDLIGYVGWEGGPA